MKFAADDPTPNGMSSSNPRFCLAPNPDSRWAALDTAVQTFVSELESTIGTEQVAMVTFASDNTSVCGETNYVVTVDQGLTTTLSLVTSAMNVRSTTVWNGNTDIEAGVVQGHQVLTGIGSRENADKVMIVFTDGQYTENNPVAAGAAAHADGITIYTITFSPGANQADMQDLAEAGKGQHFHADDAGALNDIFRELAASLSIIVQ
jgi:Mg-chelatase subunit ChlD